MMDHVDCDRIVQIAELRQAIMAMPPIARATLRDGPSPEPGCCVCSAMALAGEIAFADVGDYHDIGVLDVANLPALEHLDFEVIADAWTSNEEVKAIITALAGALAAERALVVYLLAGWKPWGDQHKHAAAALAEARP